MSTPANSQKDTIYVDVDDEITAIIDKVVSSKHKIIALVLPKRAVVLQSIVNMKLLKRTADEAKKHLVLISTESGLMPLAGIVGLHVAKSLQSKPSIPAGPDDLDDAPDDVGDALAEQEAIEEYDPADNKARSIGALAAASQQADLDDDAIEIDDIDALDEDSVGNNAEASGKKTDADAKKDGKKDKKLAVPNFNKFRLWIILGSIAVVLLIVGGILAFVVLPKATLTIATDSRDITVNKTITASTAQATVNTETLVVPAKSVSQQKTDTQKADTTGTKNIGAAAEGSVTLSAGSCGPDIPAAVPAGSGVSASGKTYILQESATFSPGIVGSRCVFRSSSVDITAQSGGADYNASSGTSFTVAGRSGITGTGSASGGTDQTVKVVSQADIDGLKAKITASDTQPISDSLKNNLSAEGWQAITATFAGGEPQVTLSANVGDQADSISVTQTTTYTMLGVKQADLKKIITADVETQLKGDKQQNIQSDGAGAAKFTVTEGANPESIKMTMAAVAVVGPELSEQEIRAIAAGKKLGDVKAQLEKIEGVEKVTAKYSPFWVSKVPSNQSKITVVFEKSR